MSPDDYKTSHMILTLDLTQFETHTKLADEVVSQFGKVCSMYLLTLYFCMT